MNQLVFIDNQRPDFKEIDGVNCLNTITLSNLFKVENQSDYDIFNKEYVNGIELMDFAVQASFSNSSKKLFLLELIKVARMLSPELDSKWFLSHAATETIIRNYHSGLPSEQDVQSWFVDNVKSLVGESFEITTVKNNKNHIPDAWLSKDNELIPVEMKLHEFNLASLRQLLRYMNHYKCSSGVAVGKEVKCVLPDNITFVKHNLFSA